jgi:hypothetical protein
LPMIALGLGLAVWALRRPPLSAAELAPSETAPEAAK